MKINELWNNGSELDWKEALSKYYESPFVKKNIKLERRMEKLSPSDVQDMSTKEFYRFLYDEYFVWKYTAPNRLATTRKSLQKYELEDLKPLGIIKKSIMTAYKNDPADTKILLDAATSIYGLGTAGASGLLSILFPQYYGTVDQFLVYALLKVTNLPEHSRLQSINPLNIKIKDGIILENILREKAEELNQKFGSQDWTPRKIDMVLWATDRD